MIVSTTYNVLMLVRLVPVLGLDEELVRDLVGFLLQPNMK